MLKNRILPDKAKTYIESIEQRLRNHILPAIGNKQLSEITPAIVLDMCRKIEALGIIATAARCKQIVGQVFKYAIATGRAETASPRAERQSIYSLQPRRIPPTAPPNDAMVRGLPGQPKIKKPRKGL